MFCRGARKKPLTDVEEPLLAQYEDETSLQRAAHQKMHSYQMIKALLMGYLPSTEQIITNMRTLLASEFLNPDTVGMSNSSKRLIKYSKEWITRFARLLRSKNNEDQIQDFIYLMIHARILVDTGDITQKISDYKVKADASAVYESIRTIGTLLLTNSEFRAFLFDLNIVSRQVFAEISHIVSHTAENAARKLENSKQGEESVKDFSWKESKVTQHDLDTGVEEMGHIITDGARETSAGVKESIKENFSGNQRKILIQRLKTAVANLRKRKDYSDSVKIVSLLTRRYVQIYSRLADQTISAVQEDINSNESLELSVKYAWSFLSSFGDKEAWTELHRRFNTFIDHSNKDPDFEHFCKELSKIFEQMLTDPDFFDSAKEKFEILKADKNSVVTDRSLREDIEGLLTQIRATLYSMVNDHEVSQLFETTDDIFTTIFQNGNLVNSELLNDTYTIFIPHFVRAIQYIPIPRLEISASNVDLLVENLIVEPGHTINQSSFLPFHLQIQLFNEFNLHKARFETLSILTSVVKIKMKGISLRADEIGFWLRAYTGLFWFTDEGIASIEMDERGMDIELDIEIGKERLEKILALRDVKVKIHNFSYNLQKSRFSYLAWILKPLLRSILRTTFEHQIASSVSDFFHAANRELLFARERLRATRISNPQDLHTFVQAVLTRLKPSNDPSIRANLGVRGAAQDRGSVFAGKYAPGSVVKLWDNNVTRVDDLVAENAGAQVWRNQIFDVQARST